MSFYSGNINDISQRRKKRRLGDIVAFAVLSAVLIFTLAGAIFVRVSEKNEDVIVPRFVEMLDSGDYEGALALYRSVHDTVVISDGSDSEEIQAAEENMARMEQTVYERVRQIEEKLLNDRYVLVTADINFLNEMGELTASEISEWLHRLCDDFLLGKIEKPDVIFIFDQLDVVTNVNASANLLRREIETIEMARGDVITAESHFDNGDYILAVQTYQSVISNYTGFVFDFANNRVDEIKAIMYQPMLELGEHMLDTLKYYSAEELLSDLSVIFPDDTRIRSDLIEATAHTSQTETYYGTVEVLCVRSLIADRTVLDTESFVGSGTDLHLTPTEFTALLDTLYANDYVLVDSEGLADLSDPLFLRERSLVVPAGKKPFILVLENLDYPARDYQVGSCERLVLNDQGEVCTEYTDASGQTVVSRNNEVIGILDSYIEEHPDFSYNGAKGVISVCGYESVFGYIIDRDEIDDRNQALTAIGSANIELSDEEIESNRQTVSAIADRLFDYGWRFASSTYGNINAYDSEMDVIVSDTEKWMTQIAPLFPEVHMLVYPGGNYIYGTDPRAEYLKDNGLRIFFGIGSNPYYIYGSNYLYYDRTIINRNTLIYNDYSRFLGDSVILDEDRR